MDNDTTTMPGVLTQPDTPPAVRESEPVNPVYLAIFVVSLLVVAALIYFL